MEFGWVVYDTIVYYFYILEDSNKYWNLFCVNLTFSKVYASDVGLRNVITGYRDKGAIFENLIYLQIKEQNPSYLYVDGIELDFITEDGILIEAKFNSVLNAKQQKLFDKFEAKKKLVVNGVDGFMKLLV